LLVYKNFNINDPESNKFELQPAHNRKIKSLKFSPCDNSLYSLGFDGIIIQWNLLGFEDNYQKLFLEKEFLVGQT